MSNARLSIIPSKAVSDPRISAAQFRTLAALGTFGDRNGWCFPSLKTLGDMLGKSQQAVSRDIQALNKLGYLNITPRFDDDGGRRSNLYQIRLDYPLQLGVEAPSTSEVDTPSTPDVEAPSTSEVEVTSHINDPYNDPSEKEEGAAAPHPLDPPSALSVYLFDRLNEDRITKNRTPVKRYGTAQQRDDTDTALMKLDRAGQMQKAVDWALRNERTSRASLCNAVIAWAKNLDKPKPTRNTRANGAPNIYDVLDKLEAERER